VETFAQGILDVADAVMEKAIRVISIERGYDPGDYALVAFGGAGGLHACSLAEALGMPRVLVPQFPGGLSALGILRADVVKDFSQTVRLAVSGSPAMREQLRREFARLEQHSRREMRAEGFSGPELRLERWLDLHYVGQAYELSVRLGPNYLRDFHRAHERRYGYADPARPAEIVNVRVRMSGGTPKPSLRRERASGANARAAMAGTRRSIFAGRALDAALYERTKLRPGNRFRGPAIVGEYSATTLAPPGWRARVDAFGNLILEPPR
jgi:N-methylhydantoinase A